MSQEVKMKPGAEKLLNYFNSNSLEELSTSSFQKIDPKWTKKTLNRVVEEHSSLFELEDNKVRLVLKKAMDLTPYIETRSEIVKNLDQFLVGPFAESEVLGEKKRPMALYLTGKLVPFGSSANVVNESDFDIQTNQLLENEKVDEYLSNRDIFRPSSMGFSFKMKKLAPIRIQASWGMYQGKDFERTSHHESWTIDLAPDESKTLMNGKKTSDPARVKYTVMKRDGSFHVSVFLFNNYVKNDGTYPLQEEIMFQTKLSVSLDEKHMSFFTSKADQYNVADELLYRDFQELAIGHGVGVNWQVDSNIVQIESTWLPFYELPSVEHTELNDHDFSMGKLSNMTAIELKDYLSIIPKKYKEWLKIQKDHLEDLDPKLKVEAEKSIKKINKMIARIEAGIEFITESDDCIGKQAFQFSNRSMMIQQAQTKVALKYRSSSKRVKAEYDGKWRLFQIMFLLMNISGVSEHNHEDREIVDLIWFPTGGGKTEAYLGVAAYLMAYRRLSSNILNVEEYAGVTIFMRYTLRLLTIQQFQRATALICAAEYIRQEQPHIYGAVPFSIGLWIGSDSSPNTLGDAAAKLEDIKNGKEVLKGNPIQLSHCPWCGTKLLATDYEFTKDTQKISCNQPQCNFYGENGLPVYTVDDAIYNQVPTIIIGTVDKIAQLPWKNNMSELFGQKNFYHPVTGFVYDGKKSKRGYQKIQRLKPPELIIQDELHLISGPLGSLTGIYEVAVDLLCEFNGSGPKIIASTATIRGAKEQVYALYGREVNQFPLPVLKADDNFVSKSSDKKPGRLYMGICAPGVSGKIQSIQTYAALSMISRTSVTEHIDPYWTMLGYFNTVKELAGMLTTFKDEIPSRLDMLDPEKAFSHDLQVEEMTSRKKAKEIPELLTSMEKTNKEAGAIDAVLATNMISVGVDVDRLGIMVVHGQPKTTSEYIQATSRVGRKYPGLVLTIFNSMRSRDLSHYERFRAYHQTLYRNVETMSVTPFAIGSRRKGLTGSLIGFLRQSLVEISKEKSVDQFTITAQVEELKERFIDRIGKTQNWNTEEAEEVLTQYLHWWKEVASKYNENLSYRKSEYTKNHLLRQFDEKAKTPEAKPAMTSLRNVEAEIIVEEMWSKNE
jgi:hypothetical protein